MNTNHLTRLMIGAMVFGVIYVCVGARLVDDIKEVLKTIPIIKKVVR